MRPKKALKVDYCERLGQQEETLAQELMELFPAWGRLPQQVCRQPYLTVANAACHPGILAERELAECRDFARLFGRFPDQVIEALRFARERLIEREREREDQKQRDAETQAGLVRSFLLHTRFVVKKAGKFMAVEALTPADFQQDRQTLCKGVKLMPVAELQDGEVAQFLSSRKFPVATQSVKRARESLSPKQPITDNRAAAKQVKVNAILDKLSARKRRSAGRKRAAKGKQ